MNNQPPCKNVLQQEWGQYGNPTFGYRPVAVTAVGSCTEGTSISLLDQVFPDEDACLRHIFDVRFGQGYPCKVCKKPAQWYKVRTRRYYRARCCRNVEIYPTSGSIFDLTRTALKDWFLIMLYFANSRIGISAMLAQRLLGVSYETAFNLCERIRTHMALLECRGKIGGPGQHVYIDEALFRGILSENSGKNKSIILGICTKSELVSTVIADRKKSTIFPIIDRLVNRGSIIVTDGFASYKSLPKLGWDTVTVNHSKNIYADENGISQAQIETYWGHMKRAFRLSHLRIERRNIWKYINCFNFVYNRRLRSKDIFWDMISCFPDFSDAPVPHNDMDTELYGLDMP